MDKFSIIIPTLWKSNRTHTLINDLEMCDAVGEIIIIDNAQNSKHYRDWSKAQIIVPDENLFVAGSWNIGVGLAKFNNIALCNDDINFHTSIFSSFINFGIPGIIGQASENYHNDYSYSMPTLSNMPAIRPWGWGCLIFLQKTFWKNIPEQLRIWHNDDWLVKFNPASKLVLHNFSIRTEMSTTSDLQEFSYIKQQDTEYWNTLQ